VTRDSPDRRARLDRKDRRVCRDRRETVDSREHRDHRDQWDRRVSEELKVALAHLVTPVQAAHREPLVPAEPPVSPGHRVQ
jgi:hypothetical protein